MTVGPSGEARRTRNWSAAATTASDSLVSGKPALGTRAWRRRLGKPASSSAVGQVRIRFSHVRLHVPVAVRGAGGYVELAEVPVRVAVGVGVGVARVGDHLDLDADGWPAFEAVADGDRVPTGEAGNPLDEAAVPQLILPGRD